MKKHKEKMNEAINEKAISVTLKTLGQIFPPRAMEKRRFKSRS